MSEFDHTIDLTPVVDELQDTFVIAAEAHIIGLALAAPGLGPFGAWILRNLLRRFVRWCLRQLAEWTAMQAFFWNTAVRKSGQARDFVKTVRDLKALPDNTDEVTYEESERARIAAFNNFVRVTS